MASKTNKTSHSNYETFETFSLIWLDSHVNKSEDNEKIQQKLQQIITHLKTFDDPQECQEYISSLSSKNRVILIISGRFGRELLPHIHSFPQIVAVYVFCMDKQANEQWAKEYSKVKSVVVRAKDLIAEIKTYEKSPENVEEPLLFSVSSGDGHSTTDINGHFVHFLLLIDVLLRIKPDEVDKASLIQRCKEKNRDDHEEVLNISKFKHEYTAEKALQWYTRDSFLYKMLNQALRFQDIDLLFLFRFVIADMCRQLKEFQYQTRVKVYRGQIMSKGELDTLQQSKGKLISINSFFSTSIVPKEALRFLESASFSNDSQRILFVIDADPNVVKSKPFADLSEVSEYKKEKEVLFMVGCVFRLNDVQRNKEQIWEIKMELCGDDNHDLKILFDHMKAKYGGGDGEVNLRSFGEVLRKMGKFDAAETMYQRLRGELSDGDPQLFSLYYSLGQVTLEKAQYDESLKWFQQSLEIIMRTDSSNYVDIAAVYGWIGNVYLKKDDHRTAGNFYHKAIELFKQAHDEDHEDLAYLYNNIAVIYKTEEKHQEALRYYQRSLDIRKKHLPKNHRDIAISHNNMGCVYLALEEYDCAMKHHKQALEIRIKSLPPGHPEIATSHANIGSVYAAKSDWQLASENYKKALDICRDALPDQHPTKIKIEEDFKRISSKLK